MIGEPAPTSPISPDNRSTQSAANQLVDAIGRLKNVAVAFSGGVDSTVVCQAAQFSRAQQVVAITGDSPSVPSGEVDQCVRLTQQIGCRHVVLHTSEGNDPNYIRNSGDRCFWCKSELYQRIENWIADQRPGDDWTLLNGTNVDDLGDYRPGLRSARQHSVVSPLVQCGIDKTMVRAIAKLWKLPVWNKPAGPCLASRVAPGEEVTPAKLNMIDQAETFLHGLGFPVIRVRFHKGNIARIEAPTESILAVVGQHQKINEALRQIGFTFVSVDLAGFSSGSLNTLIQLESTSDL